MKILFVTAYDSQTQANLSVANEIVENNEFFLSKAEATREVFYNKFPTLTNGQLMIMSHGDNTLVRDNNREIIITYEDLEKFNNTKFYLWACNTGKDLGAKISQNNNIWWGYDCPITAPINNDKYIPLYVKAFKVIKSKYVLGTNEEDIRQILDDIKKVCEDIDYQIDDLDPQAELSDLMQIYSCFRNMWANLVVWLNPQTGIKHPEAPSLLDI